MEPILGAEGPTSGKTSTDFYNQRDRFFMRAKAASETGGAVAIDAMMDSGFALASAHCNSFFQDMEVLQRDSSISRDMVAPIISTLTTLVTLRSFSAGRTDDYLAVLALGSNAALAGIDSVDKHFLFDADNVREVRELTFKAMSASEQELRARGAATFDTAFRQLTAHQTICSPASILDLTRRAIRAGQVTANSRGTNRVDQGVLVDLATELGLTGALTAEQAGAIWHLYNSGSRVDQLSPDVRTELSDLGANPLIEMNGGTPKLSAAGQNKAALLMSILDRLSPATRSAFIDASRSRTKVGLVAQAFVLVPTGQTEGIDLEVR
ncbi:hypothetical protein [Sphingomonas sp. 37zxx]|uniref:hypothetical protein n=1 Tax=Sphingomonas sp. 37zxx TaxID=1550073 RepID=UPI00053C01F3|nr:hypothetical protein [Sphingomonas sp. 37zxx]